MNSKKLGNNGKTTGNGAVRPTPKLEKVVLRLFVTGQTSRSLRAIENVSKFCSRFLNGRFELEVIDIYQEPKMATKAHVVAVPTLIKVRPFPVRRLVGDFSDQERVVSGLDLEAA